MKKLKYHIGNYVMVSKIQMRDIQGNAVAWRKCLPYVATTPLLGQVVGLGIRFDGRMDANWRGGDSWNYFIPTRSHRFWLVRFGLINKAVTVAEEDMRLAIGNEVHELPYRWPIQKMSERDRENLSKDSRNWPRDARGRWIAGPVVHRG